MFSLIQKYVLYALSVLLALSLAYAGVLYLRVGQLKNEVNALSHNVTKLEEAATELQKTITALTIERAKAAKSCEARLQGYNDTLAELQRIDSLNGGTHEIQPSAFNLQPDPADPILTALNGLFPDLRRAESGDQNGVCQARHPAGAEGPEVLPSPVSQYCFCSVDDVKNLLKNNALRYGRESDLITILEGLR